MSYDLRVAVKVEGCDKYADIAEPEYANPTYNLRDIFVACMGWDYKQGKYYRCDEVLPKINHGIQELETKRDKYTFYSPSNDWGNIDNAYETLRSLVRCMWEESECEEIPLKCLYMCW